MILKKRASLHLSAFTLLELIIGLIILSIVSMLAVPSFQAMIQNNQVLTTTNDLVNSLNMIRSEAIKRGVSVSLCAASDSTLSACGTNWKNGWLIFSNPNEDGVFANDANEILVKVKQITEPNVSISTTPTAGIVTYQPSGFPISTSSHFVFNISANGCTGNNASRITIMPTGRILTSAVAC